VSGRLGWGGGKSHCKLHPLGKKKAQFAAERGKCPQRRQIKVKNKMRFGKSTQGKKKHGKCYQQLTHKVYFIGRKKDKFVTKGTLGPLGSDD